MEVFWKSHEQNTYQADLNPLSNMDASSKAGILLYQRFGLKAVNEFQIEEDCLWI